MSVITLQSIAALFIAMISLVGGIYALYIKAAPRQHLDLAESFAGGIFLGAALFHMLPDAQTAFTMLYHGNYPWANLICAVGFCLLLVLEKLIQHCQSQNFNQALPVLMTFLISIHALSEGIALGVSEQIANMLMIFIAIAVHKSSEAFAVGLQLQRATLPRYRMISYFLIFSMMSPLGIGAGIFVRTMVQGQASILLFGIFNAFAAGTFLYLATLHKLYHQHEHSQTSSSECGMLLLGLGLMAVVAIWL